MQLHGDYLKAAELQGESRTTGLFGVPQEFKRFNVFLQKIGDESLGDFEVSGSASPGSKVTPPEPILGALDLHMNSGAGVATKCLVESKNNCLAL